MTVTDIDLTRGRRALVLAICSTGLLVVGLDATIVNIALPSIHRSPGSSLAGLQWPVGAAAILATHRFVPESRAEHPRRIDPVGQVLVIVGLVSLTYGIIEGPDHGWASIDIVASLALAAVALAVLIPYELRRREPLL